MAKILVVEDDHNNARVFEAILRRMGGFDVVLSEDVGEILDLCRRGEIDLVIMDISLTRSYWQGKKVDGIDITRLIKEDPETSHIPVLLATAHAMKGDRERFLEASGAEGYVAKPVLDHQAMIEDIRRLIAAKERTKPPA